MEKLVFGMKNLPIIKNNLKNIDKDKTKQMIKDFIENNFNIFDTSYTYHKQAAENIIADILVKNYDHKHFKVIDKLPIMSFNSNDDIDQFFKGQLTTTNLDYFDYYQIPDLYTVKTDVDNYNLIEFLSDKKTEGLIKKVGLSSVAGYQQLDAILSENNIFDYVQLDLNYLDMNNPDLQIQKCFNIACKHKIPIFASEPLKGGLLLNLPKKAVELIKDTTGDTPLTWAFRYLISIPDIDCIISNMSTPQQLQQNMQIFKNIQPLTHEELTIIDDIIKIIQTSSMNNIPGCTLSCSTCTQNCPSAQRR